MAAADYRLMTEATGQRIAAALENLAGFGAYLTTSDVVNNLTSTETQKPLSANMGKVLNDKVLLGNSTTKARFAANPDSQDAYLSQRFYESDTKWTELIFNEYGIALRRTANGGSNYTVIWQNH